MDSTIATALKKVTLPVTGMSCASCAGSVERMLQAESGVVSASVNYANASVMLEFDPKVTQVTKLQQAAQAIGYDLIVADEPEEAADLADEIQQQELAHLRTRMLFSVVLCIPLVLLGMVFMHWQYANYLMWALAHARGLLFWAAVFCACLSAGAPRQDQHGHARRAEHGYRLRLQCLQHPQSRFLDAQGPARRRLF